VHYRSHEERFTNREDGGKCIQDVRREWLVPTPVTRDIGFQVEVRSTNVNARASGWNSGSLDEGFVHG
jgi:hypothetical protein